MGRTYLGLVNEQGKFKINFKIVILLFNHVGESVGAVRAIINNLIGWFQGHTRNYNRFLHLLLKGEVSVCVIGYRNMRVSEVGMEPSQVSKYPPLCV